MVILHNKVKLLAPLVLIPLLFAAFGCAQDSIFYNISNEVAPTDPLIVGGPTKIVEANEKLYVANGNIYEYALAGNGTWIGSTKPGGKVQDLAVVSGSGPGDDTLYALSVIGTGLDFRVWEWDKDDDVWNLISIAPNDTHGYTVIQSIFGGGDKLFAGVSKRNDAGEYDYAIYYEKENELLFLCDETGILSGAGQIGSDYYLATMGSGIYKVNSSPLSVDSQVTTPSTNIAGFLQHSLDLIIAATTDGYILCGTSAGFTSPTTSLGPSFTGAIELTTAYDYSTSSPTASTQKLLLLGIKGNYSSTYHGYVEVIFDSTTTPPTVGTSYRIPGNEALASIAVTKNYNSTLRKYPVTSIVSLTEISKSAAEDAPANKDDPIIFASTPKDGLYSYRNRSDGGWQWNHEE